MSADDPKLTLDKRKAAILRAVVREYVRAGTPVGSRTLVDRYRLQFSPATIRNDMGVLEELGYITQPHTSAGRIPTDRGYRWFVDNWPGAHWPGLTERQQRQIDEISETDFGDLEQTLDSTSHVLSNVTEATAVVVAPPAPRNRLRRFEMFERSDGRATVLLIADTGVVEQGVVSLDPEVKAGDVNRISAALSRELEGKSFNEISHTLRKGTTHKKMRAKIATVVDALVDKRSGERVFTGGTSNILSPDKFADIAVAHDVVGALEQPPLISSLLDAAKQSQTVLVFIGNEIPIDQMRACAVVFAPYETKSDGQGTIGVVGPTRMDYPHMISAVEAVARSLGRLLDPD
ncbi:MAG: heat-inducible transcriptional repressor HrcA [Actinomycetota bacterium]|nr:heat-inducible transcriptional repressor HrcA [Actinomycetota bacterium]